MAGIGGARPPARVSIHQGSRASAHQAAALLVEDGMIVGVGSGTTAALVVQAIGRRVPRTVGVATRYTASRRESDFALGGVHRCGFDSKRSNRRGGN
jgi:DeoR/GlpR family transcriptional regulator of sugar metabolism